MPIPHLASVIAAVDALHREIGYTGRSRLRLREQVAPAIRGLRHEPATGLPAPAILRTRRDGVTIYWERSLEDSDPCGLRVSAAEQIGHALLHAGHLRRWAIRTWDPLSDFDMQRQAAAFAAQLLAPWWALRSTNGDPISEGEIVRTFTVTPTVARAQLRALLLAASYSPWPATPRQGSDFSEATQGG